MDHGRKAHELSTPGVVHGSHERIAGFGCVVQACIGFADGEVALLEFADDLAGAVGGDVKVTGQLVVGPATRAGVPEQEEGFEMRNAVDLFEDEAVDIGPKRVLFFHGQRQKKAGPEHGYGFWGNGFEMRALEERWSEDYQNSGIGSAWHP